MKPEEQRIAIAEACGWDCHSPNERSAYAYIDPSKGLRPKSDLPDYLNDLNAMHGVEKCLTHIQRQEYRNRLGTICSVGSSEPGRVTKQGRTRLAIHATAAQRAEAFLRTIGKWKDE